jgi:hypothetical protein
VGIGGGKKKVNYARVPCAHANVEINVEKKLDFCGFVYYRCALFRAIFYK